MIIAPNENGRCDFLADNTFVLVHDNAKIIIMTCSVGQVSTIHNLEAFNDMGSLIARVEELSLEHTLEHIISALEHGCEVPQVYIDELNADVWSSQDMNLTERVEALGYENPNKEEV